MVRLRDVFMLRESDGQGEAELTDDQVRSLKKFLTDPNVIALGRVSFSPVVMPNEHENDLYTAAVHVANASGWHSEGDPLGDEMGNPGAQFRHSSHRDDSHAPSPTDDDLSSLQLKFQQVNKMSDRAWVMMPADANYGDEGVGEFFPDEREEDDQFGVSSGLHGAMARGAERAREKILAKKLGMDTPHEFQGYVGSNHRKNVNEDG